MTLGTRAAFVPTRQVGTIVERPAHWPALRGMVAFRTDDGDTMCVTTKLLLEVHG